MKKHIYLSAAIAALALLAAGAMVISAEPVGLAKDLAELSAKDPAVRDQAISRLSAGDSRVATALLNELDGQRGPEAKGAIVKVVRAIGLSPSQGSILRSLLKSGEASTRLAAVHVLVADPELAKSELVTLMRDDQERPYIRASAAIALGGAGAQVRSSLKGILSDPETPTAIRHAALRGLASCCPAGAKDVALYVKDIDEDLTMRTRALRALCEKSAKSTTELQGLTTHPDPWVRAQSLTGLALRDDRSEIAALRRGLVDANAEVRLAALDGIVGMGLENGERAAIAKALADADVRVQCVACRSVGRSSKGIAAQLQNVLRGLLLSGNARVRYEAALSLNAHGDKYGAATMRADRNAALTPWYRQLATDALVQITGSAK